MLLLVYAQDTKQTWLETHTHMYAYSCRFPVFIAVREPQEDTQGLELELVKR